MAPAVLRNSRKRSYVSDGETSGSDYLSESEVSDIADEFEEGASKGRKKLHGSVLSTNSGSNSGSNNSNAGSNTSISSSNPSTVSENTLFNALCNEGVAITDLALNWIETAEDDSESNTTEALTLMFNLILRCCGCTHLAENHDLANYESAPATVAEVGLFYKRQKTHEYPFMTKSKSTKFFRRNVTDFFESVVELAYEKGLLYKDNSSDGDSSLTSPMMNSFLAWLFALSNSEFRPFRYVSTCLLYAIQEKLCKLAASSTLSVEKQQRQLANAQSNTSARNRQAHARKLSLITENIRVSKMQRDAVLEYIGDIFQEVFNNRYRDIDVLIRAESLSALALWATIYGEMFLQANSLRFFGWMLSDPSDRVKKENLKGLLKLYKYISAKRQVMPLGLRQLTESFKSQLISMLWTDSSAIKSTLFAVYIELAKLGLLNLKDEAYKICLYGYYLVESSIKSPLITSINVEFCNFVAVVCEIQATNEVEKYSQFLSTHESSFFGDGEDQLDLESCLRYKSLIELFDASYDHYRKIERPNLSVKPQVFSYESMTKRLFSAMYTQALFRGQWESFLRYILLDVSLVQFAEMDDSNTGNNTELEESRLKEKLTLGSKKQKHGALSIFSGMLLSVLTRISSKKTSGEKDVDDLDTALPILIGQIPKIEKFANSSTDLYTVFLNIWNSLLVSLPTSITKLFSIHSSTSVYNSVQINILTFFIEMDIVDKEMRLAFETYFAVMSKNLDVKGSGELTGNGDKLLNSHISIEFEDLLSSLVSEAIEALLMEKVELNGNEQTVDEMTSQQGIILTRLLKLLTAAQKLSQIAKSININRFISEPILESPNSLLEIMHVKLLSKIDMTEIVCHLPQPFSLRIDDISNLWISVIHLLLLAFSWSLEDLTYASGDSTAASIDVSVYLADIAEIVPYLCKVFASIQTARKELNESTPTQNELVRSLIKSLVELAANFGAEICDLLVAVRTFYSRFSGGLVFKNFDQFFDSHSEFKALVHGVLPEYVQSPLLQVFLIKEAYLGQYIRSSLERGFDEDVNIDDYLFQRDNVVMHEIFNDDQEEDESDAQAESNSVKQALVASITKWDAEEQLCVYALKLILLEETASLPELFSARLRLNKSALGELYVEVLRRGNGNEFPQEEVETTKSPGNDSSEQEAEGDDGSDEDEDAGEDA